MEVTSTNKDDENLNENSQIDDSVKEIETETFDNDIEKIPTEDNFQVTNSIDYDDDDSGDDFAVITKTSGANDSSPAKTMFTIKTISNSQIQSNYKLSKTAVDLDHPGNINGVPTIDYDLSKLVDEYKPWKKPGADVSDYFNYGFIEETWLLYCEKQKTLRLSQENSALKTLSGLQNFGYPLSGSHIHLGFNRTNHKSNKGGLIDVIGGSQQSEYKNKHNDININMVNKISTIPVQTGGVNVGGPNQTNYMSGLTNQAINSNILTPIMSAAMAMGILPPSAGNVQVLTNQQNAPLDSKMSQYNSIDSSVRNNYSGNVGNQGNWNNNNNQGHYDRSNSVDSMHSHEDYERKPYMKSDRGSRRSEHDDARGYKSRERRDRSSERRRRSRTRSRERVHESTKHSRKRNNRTPEESRRHRKHSRDRHSSGESDRKHRRHRSTKRHRQSRSRSYDNRKDRHQRRHKSPGEDSGKYKSYKDDSDNTNNNNNNSKNDGGNENTNNSNNNNNNSNNNNVKREMDYPSGD